MRSATGSEFGELSFRAGTKATRCSVQGPSDVRTAEKTNGPSKLTKPELRAESNTTDVRFFLQQARLPRFDRRVGYRHSGAAGRDARLFLLKISRRLRRRGSLHFRFSPTRGKCVTFWLPRFARPWQLSSSAMERNRVPCDTSTASLPKVAIPRIRKNGPFLHHLSA